MPRCSVHTAKALGVCGRRESERGRRQGRFETFLSRSDRVAHLQHGLLVLAVLHLGRGEVEDGPLHRVPVAVVDVDVGPPHHHVALHPAVGVRLQEVDVALL